MAARSTAGTDSFEYQASPSILQHHGNVTKTISALADGSSITTDNTYLDDDPGRWLLGRLTRSIVTKAVDQITQGTMLHLTERRCSTFHYDKDTGLLSEEIANCDGPKAVASRYLRDKFGNILTKTTSASGELTQTTSIAYDDLGRSVLSTVDPIGHVALRRNSFTNGLPRSTTDANGLTTTIDYDTFGRLLRQTNPDGVAGATELIRDRASLPKWNGSDDIAARLPVTFSYAVKTQVGSLPPTWTLYDRKGRSVRTVSDGFTPDAASARYIFKDVEYDLMGNVTRSSLPHEPKSPVFWNLSKYDALNRVCASTAPNGLRTETLYTGLPEGGAQVIVAVDPRKQVAEPDPGNPSQPLLSCGRVLPEGVYRSGGLDRHTTSRINMRKLLVEATDASGSVKYEYDAGGRITRMVGPTGAITTNVYDELGNKIRVADPDLGTWNYRYDAFGRVAGQIDAKGQISTMEYDVAGRPKRRVLPDVTTSWTYDTARMGVGKPASITNHERLRRSVRLRPQWAARTRHRDHWSGAVRHIH